ncbi:NRDE family protein [Flaviramulus aquimarinus]|uniref:NRDE family protein n=1 Tax=Flaviramulus aquimarinus TaxID=1170456 RepID=A0ABP9EUU4_9FLAO
MCTVTLILKKNRDFVLTSNRDEAPERVSLEPDFYTINNTKLLFPKDKKGGTWIGVSEKNRVVCVLNGGFLKHERKSSYSKSRGIVAKDFMVAKNVLNTVESYKLEGVEPFTMVIVDWNATLRFYELVWDGREKHFRQLPLKPKIWSSTTLYDENMKQERLLWFAVFRIDNELNAETLLHFHKVAGHDNDDYGVVMDRGFVKTTSITQVEKRSGVVNMRYENLENNTVIDQVFNLQK